MIMNKILMTGIVIVNFALVFYTSAFIFELRRRRVLNAVAVLFTVGVFLDIVSTVLMIIGSKHIAITVHGLLGYSALLAMVLNAALLWGFRLKYGAKKSVPGKLYYYSFAAYVWWITVYIAGVILVTSN